MDIVNKAKEMLSTEKGEQLTDQVLDKAAELAKSKLGADKAEQIDAARHKIDEQVGVEGDAAATAEEAPAADAPAADAPAEEAAQPEA